MDVVGYPPALAGGIGICCVFHVGYELEEKLWLVSGALSFSRSLGLWTCSLSPLGMIWLCQFLPCISTHLDRIDIGLGGILGVAVNVNDERGISRAIALAFSCVFTVRGPATIPMPVSTRACPLDPALEPKRGISFLV